MTHTVTENCIKCKYTDCVAVCPVDCFHEGENMLVIDPEVCIDCFSERESFLTVDGAKNFKETEGQEVYVPTKAGTKKAKVLKFGKKDLYAFTMKPALEMNRKGGKVITTNPRSRYTRTVEATETHLWLLANGKQTTELKPGDLVQGFTKQPEKNTQYKIGVTHGLVFGDGSWNKQEKSGAKLHLHYVQLYGDRVGKYKDWFKQLNQSPSCAEHPGYHGTGVVRAGRNLKEIPEEMTPDYLAGWLDGWLAADGSSYGEAEVLKSTNHEALQFVEENAPIAGWVVVGKGEERNTETNLSPRTRKIRWLTLRRSCAWRVMSKEYIGEEDTYCLQVEEEQAFSLVGGIYTHNCGVCIPECPANAIVPDYDPRAVDWNEENARLTKLWPVLSTKKEPLPGAKEEDGKPGKRAELSEKPGPGDQ